MVTPTRQRVTLADYEALIALPENADRRLELIDGEIIDDMPTPEHSYIVRALIKALERYLDVHPAAELLIEVRFRLETDDSFGVIPDLALIAQGRPFDLKAPVPFMPDLAIEVQSPRQTKKILATKAAYYLANGVRLVWLLYPDEQIVEAISRTDRQLLQVDKTLDGGEVLPGFSVPVRDIFPVLP
ncbi:MAG: Uma2 family endonuclease [bacterium]|nr:Uma2 family endonuclease [bacterium]